ncbi:hypothetical protein BCR39DRAFT_542682 [Naematelia encephala]|uniref:GSKIP domain-containing protein n=1 Tax=Naematelia encephala TaxID=71784 RepID=A0A1Y2ATX3_9TREE|nr:hypothetical protein BCR39DRAFT_542682 [Naematelia encephala]
MSSPPAPSNLLIDPLAELTSAIRSNSFGILPTSTPIIERSFPITPEDKEAIKSESMSLGKPSSRAVARARVELLEGGSVEIVLDQRGYTLEQATSLDGSNTHPTGTYESLDTLLIAISPGYVQAMGAEVGKRFEGYTGRDQVKGEEGGMKEALQGFHGDERD